MSQFSLSKSRRKKTAAVAQSVKIESKAEGQVLRFKLPEGGEAQVPLL